VSNVLNEQKKQQVIALGRLGWSLRRIQGTTRVRRETVADYLRAAGIALRPPGGWGHGGPAKPAIEVTTDPGRAKPAPGVSTDPAPTQPAGPPPSEPAPGPLPVAERRPSASACEPYREAIEAGLALGRNARGIWQDLVDRFGFAAGYYTSAHK